MRTEELPFVDEHSGVVDVGVDDVWNALLAIGEDGPGIASWYARLVGCADVQATGPRRIEEGSAIPGFRVAQLERPSLLALTGRHRFSTYALTFRLDELASGRTRIRAETRAVFPGLGGRVYRALVIGTGGHGIAVRRLVRGIQRRAEATRDAGA